MTVLPNSFLFPNTALRAKIVLNPSPKVAGKSPNMSRNLHHPNSTLNFGQNLEPARISFQSLDCGIAWEQAVHVVGVIKNHTQGARGRRLRVASFEHEGGGGRKVYSQAKFGKVMLSEI